MAFYEDLKDYSIMHDSRKEDFTWESTVRLVGREDEMYLEERGEGRKRKWQEGGKMIREDPEEKVQRKVPPKKTLAALGDMGGSGTSSSSSHMSPGWQVNELDLDLPAELSMNEALLSLPSLAVFKQEAPSPTGALLSPPRRAWPHRRPDDRQITNMVVDGGREGMDEGCQVSPTHGSMMMQQHVGNPESMQCQPAMQSAAMMPMNGYNSSPTHENKTGGLLMCSPASSLDGFLHSPPPTSRTDADNRFQYVLAAATSIATKQNEETLTYLNQGQPYEIKLKKLGDLSHYKGKILKSIIKICFHERRLQYMEREQIAQWHADRPGERILEVDVPLSYGVIRVEQPTCLNTLHVYWDPTKDVGVYIKVNCISTEFTAKKHGGEKGVPFRIQVETARDNDDSNRLHAAACQIKVFKLKGADRKHKQDREKVMRRPPADIDKYQPGCEATVLTTLSNDALLPPPSLVTSSPPYSPELCVAPKMVASPNSVTKPVMNTSAILASGNQMKQFYNQDGEMKVNSESCHSPGAILPDLSPPAEDIENCGLSANASAAETQSWLTAQRFSHLATNTFSNFAGADLLRLTRDDIIQICGFADGIRLYNALHAKRIEPRVTLFVQCGGAGAVHTAVYLHTAAARDLHAKLAALLPRNNKECDTVLVSGPNGSRVRLTDDVVRHLPDHATYTLEVLPDHAAMLLTHTSNQ